MLEVYIEKTVLASNVPSREQRKTFQSFSDISIWVMNQMRRPYTDRDAFQMPDDDFEELQKLVPWRMQSTYIRTDSDINPYTITFRPCRQRADLVMVHMIVGIDESGGSGILYSDGTYTGGKIHVGAAVKRWIRQFEHDINHQTYYFVEEETDIPKFFAGMKGVEQSEAEPREDDVSSFPHKLDGKHIHLLRYKHNVKG